jgi:RNA polymerase sigma-70 factor (ECF subfamily)
MLTDRNGDERLANFETAALPHMKDLFRAAVAMLGNRTEAEDVVQESYLQAWKSFHRFTLGTNCRAWLFQILFHVVCHHRRKMSNKSHFNDDLEVVENTIAYEPPVPEDLTDEEVLSAFQKLPQHYAEVVLLADVHEYAYKEIESMLGIPLGTVMSRLHRGRKLLGAHLANFAAASSVRGHITQTTYAQTAAQPC